MADNSTQGGTDTIRDKDRAGVKTQIFGLDIGIGGAEQLMQAGQQPMAASVPVVLASDQSPVGVSVPDLVITGAATLGALNNNLLLAIAGSASIDVLSYRAATVFVAVSNTAGTGGLGKFEGSNNNVDWAVAPAISLQTSPMPDMGAVLPTGQITLNASSAFAYYLPLTYRYLRLRMSTAYTGGSGTPIVVTTLLRAIPPIVAASTVVVGGITSGAIVRVLAGPGSTVNFLTANGTNAALGAGTNAQRMMSVQWTNFAAYDVFLKLYQKLSSPTVGTDLPILTIKLAAGSSGSLDFGAIGFTMNGIAYAVTKLQADSDTTAVVAGDARVVLSWNS